MHPSSSDDPLPLPTTSSSGAAAASSSSAAAATAPAAAAPSAAAAAEADADADADADASPLPLFSPSLAAAVLSMRSHRRSSRARARLPAFLLGAVEEPDPVLPAPTPPAPSPSLNALRAASRAALEAVDCRGRVAREPERELVKREGEAAGEEAADCCAGRGDAARAMLPRKRAGAAALGVRCPVNAVAHHVVRKLDALALGRRVPKQALVSTLVPTVREPALIDVLGARVYNSRFVGDHGLIVATAQNSTARIYDTSNMDAPVVTHDIFCHSTSWTISDVDVTFEGGADGVEPRFLAYSSLNNLVQLVDLRAGKPHRHEALNFSADGSVKAVWSLQLSHDARYAISGTGLRDELGHFGFSHDSGGGIVAYDMESEKVVSAFRAHDRDTNAVAFLNKASDPNLILSGSDDALACLWDLREMRQAAADGTPTRPACTFVGHTHGLTHVESRNDGRFFLTTSKDSSTKLFDVRRPSSSDRTQWNIRRVLNYDYRFPGSVPPAPQLGSSTTDASVVTYRGGHSVLKTLIRSRFSPAATTSQRYVYTGSADGACAIYETTTGALLHRLTHHSSPSRDISWHPHQPWLIVGSWDRTISSWHPSPTGGGGWCKRRRQSSLSQRRRSTVARRRQDSADPRRELDDEDADCSDDYLDPLMNDAQDYDDEGEGNGWYTRVRLS